MICDHMNSTLDRSKLEVRIHGVDGSLVSFTQDDPAVVEHIVRDCQTPDFFRQERIAVAGEHSVTTLVLSKVSRIDLAGEGLPRWKPPSGIGMSIRDIVELPEQEFLYQVEARDLKHVQRRRVRFTPGKPAVAFIAIQLLGGRHMYLKMTIVDVLPAERLQRIRIFLELPS